MRLGCNVAQRRPDERQGVVGRKLDMSFRQDMGRRLLLQA